MSRVMAWEHLNDPHYCGSLNMVQFKALLIEAGYSREDARRMANQRGWDRLQAGIGAAM